jgi:excisionase family DNA binding protein
MNVDTKTRSPPCPLAHSPKAVCALLGCGLTTLYSEIAAGRIEARKIGRKTLVTDDALRAYLASLPRAELTTNARRREAV